MDFRSFMIQGIDSEFNFLPEGGLDENQGSLSAKSVNNETPMINVKAISAVHPLNVSKNIVNSYNTSPEDDELSLVGPFASPKAEFPSARKLKDVTDCHWVVAHVSPPSWKTRELMFALHKARASCDAIQEREVSGLHNAYSMLVLEEKKWVIMIRLYPFFALKSKVSSPKGRGLRLLKPDCYRRCVAFEKVAELKEPFVLEKMLGYRPSSKEEYDRAVIVEEATVTAVFEGFLNVTCVPSHVGPIFLWNSALLALLSQSMNLAPPGAFRNGLMMSIPHFKKGHANIMDFIFLIWLPRYQRVDLAGFTSLN
nr:hypothetical protein [Tanacetum cinerariifolium]